MFVLIGIAALAIDLGFLYTTRNELQNVADAAALAGARYLGEVYSGMPVSEMSSIAFTYEEVLKVVNEVADKNKAANKEVKILLDDIQIGYWRVDLDNVIESLVGPDAVSVIARRDSSSEYGAISTFLARVFGINTMDVVSEKAVAALTGPSWVDKEKLKTPVGLSQQLFPNDCTDTIKFNPSSSCAGWHNFIWSVNASDLDTIIVGKILSHKSETPGMVSGMNQTISVRIKTNNQASEEELERIVLEAEGFRIHRPADRDRPDLLIYELGPTPTKISNGSRPCLRSARCPRCSSHRR
jgi:hypothetical protein